MNGLDRRQVTSVNQAGALATVSGLLVAVLGLAAAAVDDGPDQDGNESGGGRRW